MLRGIACEIDGRWQGPAAVPEGGGKARPQTNVARNFPRSFFETTRKRCNSNDMISNFEIIAGELRATFLGNHNVAASKVIEDKQEDVRGGSGSHLPQARRCHIDI